MGISRTEDIKKMFVKEYEVLEKNQKLIKNGSQTKKELFEGLSEMVEQYNSLLTDAIKITKIGDASQRKLMKANEKIETLNEKLKESEQNVKELNTIFMHYIKATDR